jgi:hypothetical protein
MFLSYEVPVSMQDWDTVYLDWGFRGSSQLV